MLKKSIMKIFVAGLIAAAAISPTWAAKTPNTCAMADKRCTATATCDKQGWCKVYGCVGTQTVLLPFACNSKAGGCLQKHC